MPGEPRPPVTRRLKYGLNPQQAEALLSFPDGREWLRVVNGTLGYVNVLDALRAWQLAIELARAFARPAATSVKHVHPAGAAVAAPLDERFRVAQRIPDHPWSPIATAYARARAGDRVASFGDFIGVSEPVDESCARLIAREVSDGIVAPGYSPEAVAILSEKKGGRYLVLLADPSYEFPETESRTEAGVALQQARNATAITRALFDQVVSRGGAPADDAVSDLVLATIVAKHTPSNAVCIAHDGQAIGIGGGQQARIHATRNACERADLWRLQLHPRVQDIPFVIGMTRSAWFNVVQQWLLWPELDDADRTRLLDGVPGLPPPLALDERRTWITGFRPVVMSSDGYIPFRDNVDRARQSGIHVIAQPGGSANDEAVARAADESGIVMVHTGVRLFWH
jgi:phosphoribosylaminoimidazolecarboxamide formyltransferase/IMP cyclohydrolase/phosphoribosylaminoimidazolecarboxamide formyltransferase